MLKFTYFESVSVDLGTQHIMRMHNVVICAMPGSTVFFHIFSQDFRKEKNIEIKCVFDFLCNMLLKRLSS